MSHRCAKWWVAFSTRLPAFSFLVSWTTKDLQSQTPLPTDDEAAFKQETDRYEKEFGKLEKSGRQNQAFHYDLSSLTTRLPDRMRAATTHQTKDVIESDGSATLRTCLPSLHCTCLSALLLLVSTNTRLLSGFSAATWSIPDKSPEDAKIRAPLCISFE